MTKLVTKAEALKLTTKWLRNQDLSAEVALALLVLYAKIAGWNLNNIKHDTTKQL